MSGSVLMAGLQGGHPSCKVTLRQSPSFPERPAI